MVLKELYVQNFRNYQEGHVEFCDGINILLGENAQGKTNLLEAVNLLSGRKSFRARREQELIFQGRDRAGIMGKALNLRGEDLLRLELGLTGRKRIFRNDVKKDRASELSQSLRTVLFLPEDLRVIEDGASARRRFMDNALVQLSPRYDRLLRDYQRVLEQKGAVLRDGGENPQFLDLLPEYNRQLSLLGAGIMGLRARFLRHLSHFAQQTHQKISGGRDRFSLTYETVSVVEDPLQPAEALAEQLERHLTELRAAELRAGVCLSGIQRDDFSVEIGGQPARYFGSKGQIRTAAISLKLAERQIYFETFQEYPVLLLDDVLSELDDRRRDFVVNQIEQGQVLLTCCRQEQVRSGKIFSIAGGTISPWGETL